MVGSKRCLKIVICDEDGNISKSTKNIVYKEVLQVLWSMFNMYVQLYKCMFYTNFQLYIYSYHQLLFTLTFFFVPYLGVHWMNIAYSSVWCWLHSFALQNHLPVARRRYMHIYFLNNYKPNSLSYHWHITFYSLQKIMKLIYVRCCL